MSATVIHVKFMSDLSEKVKECASCGKMAPIAIGQYWYNNLWPLSGGSLIEFHCEECAKKGRKIFILALVIIFLMVSGLVLYHF